MSVDGKVRLAAGRADDSRSVSAGGGVRLGGLDGLRAVAIVAVVIFHLDPTWLPGGFLGVDVFFVISGFLITTLLVRERDHQGRIHLREFWIRRARRLLPAVLVLVPTVVLLARLVDSDLLVGIRRQVLGALTFTSNWLDIAAGSNYFHSTSPQLLMNLWSLAVEEQFYLVWPLVVALLLAAVSSTRARVAIAGALGAASAILMAVGYTAEDATRVYYGTDTHLVGLMLGAALAFAWAAPHRAWTTTASWQRLRVPLTAAAAITLGALFVVVDESTPVAFRGGITVASLATTVLVLAAIERTSPLRRALDAPPMRWIGRRSYGLYLWHWPVILLIESDVQWATPTSANYLWSRVWCVLVTVALADLSYRFTEMPVRRHGFRGAVTQLVRRIRYAGPRTARAFWASAAVLTIALGAVLLTAPARSRVEQLIGRNTEVAAADDDVARPGRLGAASPSPSVSASLAASPLASPSASPSALAQTWAMPTGAEIDGFGDSMMVGSVHALRYYFPGIRIDAKSNRQWRQALRAVTSRGADTRRAVVLSVGTNAGTDIARARETLDALGPDRMVVIVTLHARMNRITADNKAIRSLATGRDNVAIADWDAALRRTEGQLQSDGIHPSLAGAHLYAATIRSAFAQVSTRHTGKKVSLPALPGPRSN